MYEVLTTPSAFPVRGMTSAIDYRTHPRDLLAQKLSLSVPETASNLFARILRVNQMNTPSWLRVLYVIAYPLSALMLIVWAIVTFAYDGPGWIHFFLSLGMFLLIWRIVAGGTQDSWRKYLSGR